MLDYLIYKNNRLSHQQKIKEGYEGELQKLERNYLSDTMNGVQTYPEHYKKNKQNWLELIKTRERIIEEIMNETDEDSQLEWQLELEAEEYF